MQKALCGMRGAFCLHSIGKPSRGECVLTDCLKKINNMEIVMPTVKEIETTANCIALVCGEEERERFISKLLKKLHAESV